MKLTECIQNSVILSDPDIVPQSKWNAIAIDGEYCASFIKMKNLRLPNVNRSMTKDASLDAGTPAQLNQPSMATTTT